MKPLEQESADPLDAESGFGLNKKIALARFAAGALSFPEKERFELVENLSRSY